VFEAFRRATRDVHSATPGIGLGLALARGLARELGGDLKLLRLNDAGAAFSLTLPM
jgi:signal transduction histidine kinase